MYWKCGCKKYCCTSTHSNVVKGIVSEVMKIIAALALVVIITDVVIRLHYDYYQHIDVNSG